MPTKADRGAVAFSWLRVGYFALSTIFFLFYCLVQEGVRDAAKINPHASGDAVLILIPAMGIVAIAAITDAIAIAIKVFKRETGLVWFHAYVVHFIIAILLLLITPLRF